MSEESKCPVTGKSAKRRCPRRVQRHIESGLVAEPVEPQNSPSTLGQEQPDGGRFQLC
jgi:hypothetical protein